MGNISSRNAFKKTTIKELLVVKNLNLYKNASKILSNISFTLQSDQILTIIGPNGAGKTTLIRAILGLIPINFGSIWIDPGSRIGYIPQRINLNPLMKIKVYDFLNLFTKEKTKKSLDTALIQSGINPLLGESFMNNLSGGEYQRVLLAHLTLLSPNLIILDEPTKELDSLNQLDFFNFLKKIKKSQESSSIILISHDLHFVLSASDYVICLNNHICCSGSPKSLVDTREFNLFLNQDLFFKNFSFYNHNHDHKHI